MEVDNTSTQRASYQLSSSDVLSSKICSHNVAFGHPHASHRAVLIKLSSYCRQNHQQPFNSLSLLPFNSIITYVGLSAIRLRPNDMTTTLYCQYNFFCKQSPFCFNSIVIYCQTAKLFFWTKPCDIATIIKSKEQSF